MCEVGLAVFLYFLVETVIVIEIAVYFSALAIIYNEFVSVGAILTGMNLLKLFEIKFRIQSLGIFAHDLVDCLVTVLLVRRVVLARYA